MERWDQYFFNVAKVVAENSRCFSRKIGVVVVKDNRYIISTGYNGPSANFPNPGTKGFSDIVLNIVKPELKKRNITLVTYTDTIITTCPRKILGFASGEGVEFCPCAHAEGNAVASAARLGHPTKDCSLYLNVAIPCLNCAYAIVNAGIKEVIVTEIKAYEKEGFTGLQILQHSGVTIRTYTENK